MYKVYDKYYFMPERMDYAARCLSEAAFKEWFNEIIKINGVSAQNSFIPSGETVIELIQKGFIEKVGDHLVYVLDPAVESTNKKIINNRYKSVVYERTPKYRPVFEGEDDKRVAEIVDKHIEEAVQKCLISVEDAIKVRESTIIELMEKGAYEN